MKIIQFIVILVILCSSLGEGTLLYNKLKKPNNQVKKKVVKKVVKKPVQKVQVVKKKVVQQPVKKVVKKKVIKKQPVKKVVKKVVKKQPVKKKVIKKVFNKQPVKKVVQKKVVKKVVNKQPVKKVVVKPAVQQKPKVVQRPVVQQKPKVIQRPTVVQNPKIVNNPKVVNKPVVNVRPNIVNKPQIVVKPQINVNINVKKTSPAKTVKKIGKIIKAKGKNNVNVKKVVNNGVIVMGNIGNIVAKQKNKKNIVIKTNIKKTGMAPAPKPTAFCLLTNFKKDAQALKAWNFLQNRFPNLLNTKDSTIKQVSKQILNGYTLRFNTMIQYTTNLKLNYIFVVQITFKGKISLKNQYFTNLPGYSENRLVQVQNFNNIVNLKIIENLLKKACVQLN